MVGTPLLYSQCSKVSQTKVYEMFVSTHKFKCFLLSFLCIYRSGLRSSTSVSVHSLLRKLMSCKQRRQQCNWMDVFILAPMKLLFRCLSPSSGQPLDSIDHKPIQDYSLPAGSDGDQSECKALHSTGSLDIFIRPS